MLFFLQPIVRGWARYQGRLMLRPTPLAAQQTLDSIALRDSKQSLREVQYWAEQRLDRLALAADILRRLDQQGWPNKSDIGWSDYDVEVYDTPLEPAAAHHRRRRASPGQTTDPLPAARALGAADQGRLLVAVRL